MTRKHKKHTKRTKKLKVAHVVPVTPNRCGMYESCRELVLAERRLGINANIVDPRPYESEVKGKKMMKATKGKCPACGKEVQIVVDQKEIPFRPYDWYEDRGVCAAPLSFALESDVIVSHSGLDKRFEDCQVPRIHLAHGRPNSSYRIERSGETKIYSTYREMAKDKRWKAMVTLWHGFQPYWELVFPKVLTFTPFVDLNYWKRESTPYDFNGHGGSPNVVCADIWRKDKDPFHVINAFVLFAKKYPDARLHLYGIDKYGAGRDTIIEAMKDRGIIGEVQPIVGNLKMVYSNADMLITPHTIATRTVREALATGLQVVAGWDNPYARYSAVPEQLNSYANQMELAWEDWQFDEDKQRKLNREEAEKSFNINDTATKFVELFEEITGRAA